MICTKCKADNAHRSHRSGLKEHLASLAGSYPYRCRSCEFRFSSKPGALNEAASAAMQEVNREITSTRNNIRSKRKRRDLALYVGALLMFGVILYFLTRPPSMGG